MRHAAVLLALVVSLAACRATPRMRPSPGPALDPLVTLPFTDTIEVPPVDHPLPEGGGDLAFDLTFRIRDGEKLLLAPTVTVLPGERSQVSFIEQCAFVADFDLEVKGEAFIADPVIEIVTGGLALDCVAVPRKDGEGIVLAWRLVLTDLRKPIRAREIVIGRAPQPVVVQLPAVESETAVGRALVAPGVETLLTRAAGGKREIAVSVSAVPIRVGEVVEPRTVLLDDTGPAADPAPEPLLDGAPGMDPLPEAATLEVTLATLRGPRLETPLHLDTEAAAPLLAEATPLRSRTIAAAAEDGARIGWTTAIRYHQDFGIEAGMGPPLYDPIIDTLEVGFTGRVGTRNGEPVLSWTFATLASLDPFTTRFSDDGPEVSIEIPEVVRREGVLRLRGEFDIHPVGTLTDGRTVVLVVARRSAR